MRKISDANQESLLLAAALVLAVAGLASAQESAGGAGKTWNAAEEFSAQVNPNGVWTYCIGRDGVEMKGDGTQTGLIKMIMNGPSVTSMWPSWTQDGMPDTTATPCRFFTPGIVGWKATMYPGEDPETQLQKQNLEFWCVVAKNVTGRNLQVSDWTAPARKLILNSCQDRNGSAQRTIVQFKAPGAAAYAFKATWASLRKDPSEDIACMVYSKGRRVDDLNGRIFQENGWRPFAASHTVRLDAGDTLWFCSQNQVRYCPNNPLILDLTVTASR
jgi:hypothetical protein